MTEGEMKEAVFWLVCYLIGGIGGLVVGGVAVALWILVGYILEAVR